MLRTIVILFKGGIQQVVKKYSQNTINRKGIEDEDNICIILPL